MNLELKSFFSNKIIKLTLIVSILLSVFMIYYTFENGENLEESINFLRNEIVSDKKNYDHKISMVEMYTPTEYKHLKDEYIKSMDWEIEVEERLLALYSDGYRKNEEEIRKLSIYQNLYYMSFLADFEKGYKYSTQVFKEDIEEYLDLSDLPFDLYALEDLHHVSWSHVNSFTDSDKEELHRGYEVNKKNIEREFFLLKNNLKEVDSSSISPWTYLAYIYSYISLKTKLFVPILIIVATYMVIYSRKEKSLDLVKLKPDKKQKIYTHYLKITLIVSLSMILIPDLLAIIFMGIKNGFYGLRNPIGMYMEGLRSFYPYKNIGNSDNIRGLGVIFATGYNCIGNIMEFPGLTNIEFYKFLLLSSIPSLLKIIFFVSLGISIGLLIKNNTIGLIVSSLVTLFTLLSANTPSLKTPYNIFSLDSGWNITLGHTNFSWLGSVVGLSIGIILVVAVSLIIFNRQELD